MRILHCVQSYYPSIGGMPEVVRQLSERLVQLGHEVTVATSTNTERSFDVHNGVRVLSFDVRGNWTQGLQGEVEVYREFLVKSDFDVITFFAAQQWSTDAALEVLHQIKAAKVSVPTGYSGLYNELYKTYFHNMKNWIVEYDMNVYLSNDYRDIQFAKNNRIDRRIVIPNGAGADEFDRPIKKDIRKKYGIDPTHRLLLHVGSFTGLKGHKEVVRILMAMNSSNLTLLMLGERVDQFRFSWRKEWLESMRFYWYKHLSRTKRIIVDHASREDVVDAYKQGDLFMFPSNIECSPIVLFEACAAALPFATADVGNSTEIVSWTNGGIILPTKVSADGQSHVKVDDAAFMIEDLLEDKDALQQMAHKGKAAWHAKYSWEVIAVEYEQLYKSLINKK